MARVATVSCVILLTAGTVTACDERRSPTAATAQSSALTVAQSRTIAQPRPTGSAPSIGFNYLTSVTLRASGAAGATISRVTATLTQVSGAATVVHLSVIDVFGTNRVAPDGMLTSTISLSGTVPDADQISVQIFFIDDNGNEGSARTSTAVRLDLTGRWIGPLGFLSSQPGDWISGSAELIQTGASVTGDLVSRDGRRLSVSGTVSGLSVAGLVSTAVIQSCGISLTLTEVEFASGRAGRIAYRATGRCPGTVAGSFELRRSA
jgi:hypothetical protein